MVAYARQEDSGGQIPVILISHLQHKPEPIGQFGIVCPKCCRHLMPTEYKLMPETENRHGFTTRSYFGWHLECNTGCQVIQLKQDGWWFIHKFRLYTLSCGKVRYGDWIFDQPLPEPAPVVTGQGGNTDSPYTPEVIDLMDTVLTALKATVKTVESLLKLAKLKK